MEDQDKTREQLIYELNELRQKVTQLEACCTPLSDSETMKTPEDRFRRLLEGAPDAVFIQTGGVFSYLNQQALQLFGASSSQDLLGRPVLDRFHPDFREIVQERIRLLNIEKKRPPSLEQIYLRMDGSAVNVEVSGVPINFQGQDGALVFVRDITERKVAEKALKETQESLELALKGADLGRWDVDLTTGTGIIDDRIYEIIEYSPGELECILEVWQQLLHPDDIAGTLEHMQEHLQGHRDRLNYEYRIRKKSGEYVWLMAQGKIVDWDQDNRPLRIAGTVMDITSRKNVEEKLRQSEELLNLAVNAANLGLWDLDITTGKATINETSAQIIGYTLAELDATVDFWQNAVHPDDRSRVLELFRLRLVNPQDFSQSEYRLRTKSGEYIWIHSRGNTVRTDDAGNPLRMAGTFMDITERKQMEEALRTSERTFRTILATSPVGIGLAQDRTMKWVNDAWVKMFGYDNEQECIGRSSSIFYSSPEEYERVGRELYQGLETGRVTGVDAKGRKKDGSLFDAHVRLKLLDPNQPGGAAISVLTDISESKKAEAQLQDSQERLELALKGADLGMWDLDITTGQAVINERFAEMGGYTLDELEPTRNLWQNSIHPDDAIHVLEDFNKAVEGLEDSFQYEYRLQAQSGEYIWVLSRGKVVERDEHGRALRMAGTAMDITAQKHSEEALRASEEKYGRIVETVNEGIWAVDKQFNITFGNRKLTEMVGYSSEEIVGSPITLLLFTEDIEAQSEQLRRRLEGMKDVYERRLKHKDGSEIWVLVSATPLFDSQGNFDGSFGTFTDITKLKDTERNLRESEEKFSKAFRYAPVFMTITNLDDGTFLEANETLLEMTGFSRGEIIGKTSLELGWILEQDRTRVFEGVSEHGLVRGMELKLPTKDGRHIMCSYTSQLMHINERPVILSIGHDVTELRRSQSELQDEKDKLKSILDSMNDGVYMVNPHHEIEYINPALQSDYGQIDGSRCYMYFHDRVEPCPWCPNQRIFAGESVQWEWHSEKAGKTYELFDTPVRHSDGSVSKLSIFHDVTARKTAENALIESEERFRQVAESTGDWIWEVDADGMFTYCTSASERILGYSVDELVGKKFFYDLFVPGLKEELQQQALATFSSKKSFRSFVNANVRKDGQIVILETSGSPIIDEDGSLIGYRGADTDVTERVQAQEAQLRLIAAIEKASEGIAIMDAEGTIEYVNSGYEHITGYRREEVVGAKHYLFEPDDYDESLHRSVQEALSKGLDWSDRLSRSHKNESKYTEDIRLSPVHDTAGKVVNYVAIKRDVSYELSMQQQLLQAQKMEAVGTLAGGIAHDFNNILQVVLGYSELMLDTIEKTSANYAELEKIHDTSIRGADLVQNLMMFSRKVEPNLKPLNLNDEVAQIQKLLSRTIPKNIKLTALLSGDLKLVEADVSQMGQVLMNLAVNARDAMPDGGKLNFETSNVELDKEYCSIHPGSQPGTYVLLTVSDTGTGMTEETVSHIFEPFFTTKGVGHGTGLGLATVYGIVKQHRGYITCESEIGKGTCFKVYLPAIDKECENDAQECKAPLVGGTETILLVDDEEHLRDLGATMLKRYGYEVLTAGNGKEALNVYRTNHEKISLVILDLIMPEMDGKKCLVELLNINPQANVLIASGHSEGILAMETSLHGAKGLVAKPYQMKKLLQAVRDVLDAVG